jgi:hypothetical protein
MLKYFKFPFATSGDKTAVPDASQPSGSVSYTDGFGVDYELDPGVDPAAKNVPRDETNQLFYDITNAVKEIQEFGTPDFITAALNGGVAFSYSKFARVKYTDGFVYVSKIDLNTDLPTVAASWFKLTENAGFLAIGDAVFEASVTDGEVVYWDNANNRFDEAISDGTVKQNVVGFADVTNARVFVAGLYAGQLAGLTPGATYYLSSVTPGALVSIVPTSNAVHVGTAKTATDLFITISLAAPTATETISGTARSATQAEMDAGTGGNQAVTPAKARNGFAISLAATGYVKLPSWLSGLVIQWGAGANSISGAQNINLPLAFPTAHLRTVVSSLVSEASPADVGWQFISCSTTVLRVTKSVGNNQGATPLFISIGH